MSDGRAELRFWALALLPSSISPLTAFLGNLGLLAFFFEPDDNQQSIRWASGLGILSILLLFGIVVSLLDVWRADRAMAWPTTDGIVVESKSQGCGRGGAGYRPEVVYKYQVGGNAYENWRIVFGAASCGSRQAAKAITDRFPVSAIVKVSFDPQAPAEAVLIAGKVDDSTWTGIYFMSFWFLLVAAATGMLVHVARSTRVS